jgi:hypothetical protein
MGQAQSNNTRAANPIPLQTEVERGDAHGALPDVKLRETLELKFIGAGPDGVAKVTGLLFAGDHKHPGTDYVAEISGKTIKQT